MAKESSKLALIKKALYIWAVQYHFVIPKRILKMYIHKFRHESANIAKYGQRFYDPADPVQYRKWLELRELPPEKKTCSITFIGRSPKTSMQGYPYMCMPIVDSSKISTEYVGICGKDITLYPEFHLYCENIEDADIIYTDFDHQVDGERQDPILKPDFSYFALRQFDYVGPLYIVKKEILARFEGQDLNPYLWMLELSDQNLKWKHISAILYATEGQESYDYKAVSTYMDECGLNASIVENATHTAARVDYPLQGEPLVSIIIPTKDGVEVLRTCIDSILAKSTYTNYEILIADNNSTKEETFQYFKQLEKNPKIHIVRIETPFNFSLINNRAIAQSHGDYIVMLNNDTEIITRDWLEKMLRYAQMPRCGSVGVKLYYEDGTIQHGGVIAGKGGGFAHRYYRKPHDEKGYLHTMETVSEVACSTAACLMIPRKKFDEVGGMNEELTVQFNDVDLGLKLYEHGYSNVWMPDVELYHYESKSRGIDKDKKSVDRFMSEVDYAKKHYAMYLEHDPFYNDQFDKNYDFMLKVGTGSNE